MRFLGVMILLLGVIFGGTLAQEAPQPFDIGTPVLTVLWVNPTQGNDNNDGTTPQSALQTIFGAWQKIPVGVPLETGYHIKLMPGTYGEGNVPIYWESRYGTASAPIIIEATDGRGTAILTQNVNVYDVRYLYFINIDVITGFDAFHCEKCTYLLLRGVTLRGDSPETYNAQETFKANQSQYVYLEDSDISGAWDNAVDFVAVQYGHVLNSRIYDAGDWCLYLKGGSAYFTVSGNIFSECGTGGFTAGQGTGFQYMVEPWIHYEAYAISFINNHVHDTFGAAWGVNGGWQILIANNTAYRVGERSHLIEAVYGLRSCDGQMGDDGRERCQHYLEAGGWGTTVVDDGTNAIKIPNRSVYMYNNIVYNPAPYRSEYQHFAIFGETQNVPESNIPIARGDDDLRIVGNVIWNGSADHPLGVEDGAACTSETCSMEQLRADNVINRIEPTLEMRDGVEVPIVAGFVPIAIPPFPNETRP